MNFFGLFKKKEKTIKHYQRYPEQPYISQNRDMNQWLERVAILPDQSLVKKEMMIRNKDNLLPGHIYLLYWSNKFSDKKVPVYFEFKYGINVEKEIIFLQSENLLSEKLKATEKGLKMMDKYKTIIEKHSGASKKRTKEQIHKETIRQLMDQKKSYINLGFSQFEFIASPDSCSACKGLDGKIFNIKEMKSGKNSPPMHEGCRCSTAAYFNREEWDRDLKKRGL